MSKTLSEITKEPSILFFTIATGEKFTWKAPTRKMFKLKGISYGVNTSGANPLSVYDKELPEDLTNMYFQNYSDGIIDVFYPNSIVNFYQPLNDYLCKYISLIFNNSSPSVRVLGCIHFELVDASEPRVMYEFIKNARIR